MELPDRVEVIVTPDARKTRIVRMGPVLRVEVKAPARDGKANVELERFLSRQTGRHARVVRGRAQRRKTVRLS